MRQISPVSRQRSSLVARSPQIEMPNLTTRDLNKLAEMKTAFSAYPNEDRIQSSFEFPVPAVFKAVLEVTYFAVPKEQDQWSALGTNNSQFMSEIASDCSVLRTYSKINSSSRT